MSPDDHEKADTEGAEPATCKVTVVEKLTVKLSSKSFIYNGKIKMPTITVKSGSKVLGEGIKESNENVIVIMEDSILPGTYTVNVIARDWEYGSAKAKYQIKVKAAKLKPLKAGKKRFTAKWNRVGKTYITGYQIRYSTKKNMKNAKIKTVKSWKTVNRTVKKLKGGKKYYVQIRTYLQKDGTRYYSTWSAKRSVKVRK